MEEATHDLAPVWRCRESLKAMTSQCLGQPTPTRTPLERHPLVLSICHSLQVNIEQFLALIVQTKAEPDHFRHVLIERPKDRLHLIQSNLTAGIHPIKGEDGQDSNEGVRLGSAEIPPRGDSREVGDADVDGGGCIHRRKMRGEWFRAQLLRRCRELRTGT